MAMAALLPVFSRLLLSSGKCGDNNTISGESIINWLTTSGYCGDNTEAWCS